jgi:hypothetical protein
VEDIVEQFTRRDRFLKRRQMQMTPQQRMLEMRRMQARGVAILKQSPEGYARFIARNYKQRAIKVFDPNAT